MSVNIIDGVSTSGKSVVLKKMQLFLWKELPEKSKWFITEHFTLRYFKKKAITPKAVTDHIKKLFNNILEFKKIQADSIMINKPDLLTVCIERLLLSFYSRNHIGEEAFKELAELFDKLDTVHYLLKIPDDKFEQHLTSSLIHRRNDWRLHIESLGGIEKAIPFYKNRQDKMIEGHYLLSKYSKTQIITLEDTNTDFLNHVISSKLRL